MANVDAVRKTAGEFLKKTLNVKDVKIIKAAREGGGWDVDAEVYEESSFIKSLGLSTKVQDRNIYAIRLDENLEVQSYQLQENK